VVFAVGGGGVGIGALLPLVLSAGFGEDPVLAAAEGVEGKCVFAHFEGSSLHVVDLLRR